MAHYALINTENIVTQVIVGIDENELIEGDTPETWYGNLFNQLCKRTSYNGNIRKQYAGIGYTYNAANDVFICPQPYPSWTLDENFDWQPPLPMPIEENKMFAWFEPNQQWIEINNNDKQEN
jgi:hypothetical protein